MYTSLIPTRRNNKKGTRRQSSIAKESSMPMGIFYNIYLSDSLAFNPITLEYAQTEQGQNLKKRDEESLVRGYVRA